MPSSSQVVYTRDAFDDLARIGSKKMRANIRKRIIALQVFPQSGLKDPALPTSEQGVERRVTFVAPYAIRYSYLIADDIVRVDAITDERNATSVRFL